MRSSRVERRRDDTWASVERRRDEGTWGRDEGTWGLENHSGYDTEDLRRFLDRAFRATGTPTRGLRVLVFSSPIYTRGCATVRDARARQRGGPSTLVLHIAAPNRFSLRTLARKTEHELAHLQGAEHRDMDRRLLYASARGVPSWARGTKIRYRGRAPRQLPFLRRGRGP